MAPQVDMPIKKIEAFCKKWKIIEFSLFGSVVREDFHSDSDVDVLVTFEKDARYTLFDMMDMEDELKSIFNRSVDFVEEECLVNPFRRKEIIRTKKVIYAA
jgi:predicted nucleotidyltransferase